MNTETFACYSRCSETRYNSSSGGIYALLAESILNNNGIVFAVCYNDHFETLHKEIQTVVELLPSMGSKYVPSRLNNTFSKIKEYLLEGKKILFVGTPCQCEGLLSYLGKDYDKLLTIDLVCHGVPSRVAWRSYLNCINKDGKLSEINMRDKTSGWSRYQYSWKLRYRDGKDRIIPQGQVSYMKGFTSNYFLRPSCYECRFKGTKRATDITLGDYWGVWDIQPEMDDNKGTSLLLIHTEKGNEILDSIRANLKIKRTSLEIAIQYNPSIVNSANKFSQRDIFLEKIQNGEDIENIMQSNLLFLFKDFFRGKSINILNKLIFKKDIKKWTPINKIPILYNRKELCCGCTACYAICPKAAIAVIEDEEGFDYPQINEEKCIRCYQCFKLCPIKRKDKINASN